MQAQFHIKEILEEHGITAYRLMKESGIGYGTAYELASNRAQVVKLKTLAAVLDALCRLTGHCYKVGDVIKIERRDNRVVPY